ncbi:MAG: hypothetical protein KF712_13735 [Akkermansiaceae bacterium]|nr:hypothetical protein [Akkermansiaceae bacterium]
MPFLGGSFVCEREIRVPKWRPSLRLGNPAVGWWRERHHLGKFDKQTRYSLAVSFALPDQNIDIYTLVANSLGIATPVEIEI